MEQSGFCLPLSKPLSTVILKEAVWQWKKYEPRCQDGVLQNWHVGHLKLKSIYSIFILFFNFKSNFLWGKATTIIHQISNHRCKHFRLSSTNYWRCFVFLVCVFVCLSYSQVKRIASLFGAITKQQQQSSVATHSLIPHNSNSDTTFLTSSPHCCRSSEGGFQY